MADELKEPSFVMTKKKDAGKGLKFVMKKLDLEDLEWVMVKDEDPWTEIGTYFWDATTDTDENWKEESNAFGVAGLILKVDYNTVKIVGEGDAYCDNIPNSSYLAALGITTDIDFVVCGHGDTLEVNAVFFSTHAAAEDAWKGSEAIVKVGDTGRIGFGYKDVAPENNSGGYRFSLYGRNE